MYAEGFDEEYKNDDIYDNKRRERQERPVFQREELLPREIEKIVEVREKIATPKWPDLEIKPLKTLGGKAIGNLFDRVDFLKNRIDETEANLKLRKTLHMEMLKEIDVDIKDKQEIEAHLSDLNEKRNFKLDISMLRREKRQEAVQFWRDILELTNELKELKEEFRMETRVLDIFQNLKGVKNDGS
jgi:hypothetical protein